MAIEWTAVQRRKVGRILRECPAPSGRCEQAAKRILLVARERDDDARACRLTPRADDEDAAPFVVPAASVGDRWRYHVAVHTTHHYVDALTGVDGTEESQYLRTHWKYPDALTWHQEDPNE